MNALMRTIGRSVAAGAVALVVVGSTVGIAAATRDDAVRQANEQIDYCFQTGGDVEVFTDSTGDSITVICSYPSGRQEVCTYNPVTKCWEVKGISAELTALIPAGSLPELAVLDPSGEPAQPVAGPTTPDDHQKHAKSKTRKKHRHGGKTHKK